jgi:hypothetical protein
MAEHINKSGFSPQQINFIDTLVASFVRDGYVPVGALCEPPFDQFHFEGPEALFVYSAEKVMSFVEMANRIAKAPSAPAHESRAG